MLVIKLVKNNLKHYLIFIFFILDQAHMNFQNFILLLHRAKRERYENDYLSNTWIYAYFDFNIPEKSNPNF